MQPPTWDLFIYIQCSAEKGLFPGNTPISIAPLHTLLSSNCYSRRHTAINFSLSWLVLTSLLFQSSSVSMTSYSNCNTSGRWHSIIWYFIHSRCSQNSVCVHRLFAEPRKDKCDVVTFSSLVKKGIFYTCSWQHVLSIHTGLGPFQNKTSNIPIILSPFHILSFTPESTKLCSVSWSQERGIVRNVARSE